MKIAVRALCEFAARQGSLEYNNSPSPTAEQGIQGHKVVQFRRGATYQPEYLLEGSCLGMQLRGRADGYQHNASLPLLEEIKTHSGDVARISPDRQALHLAQLKVYGALLCARDKLDEVSLRLVYYDIHQDQETPLTTIWSCSALTDYLVMLCRRYKDWHQQERQHRQQRDEALFTLRFPFNDFRPQQRNLSENVYKAISTARPLLVEAPTGIGKTLGVIFPALLTLPRQHLDRLFLLTARTTGRQLILDTLQQLQQAQSQPIPIRILELTAKEKACVHPDLACDGASCPLALGFFDRLPAARQAAATLQWLDNTAVANIAHKHQLCPYYLAQEMARWSDVVIGDVNHYFEQHALLYSLTRANEWRVVPLIDEAHNLIERARGMYSSYLPQTAVFAAIKQSPASLKNGLKALQRAWRKLILSHLNTEQVWPNNTVQHHLEHLPKELNGALQRVIRELSAYMSERPLSSALQELLFNAVGFMKLAEQFGSHSLCTLSAYRLGNTGQVRASLALQNLIPADFLAQRFEQAYACVLFSATLSPARYYQDLLGMPEHSCWRIISSPFSSTQLTVRTVAISTRFNQRQRSVSPIALRIIAQYKAVPGNYLVYVSSFAYLNQLQQQLALDMPSLATLSQTPSMTEAHRNEFIAQFRNNNGLVGLAVLGGAFGEGIDLPGEQLIGVFIVTLGLPPVNAFQQQLCQRLAARFGQGDFYTYLLPGMRKVIQAAGRLIRTPEDTGVIELIDERFNQPHIQALLPAWWPKTQTI